MPHVQNGGLSWRICQIIARKWEMGNPGIHELVTCPHLPKSRKPGLDSHTGFWSKYAMAMLPLSLAMPATGFQSMALMQLDWILWKRT